LAQASLASAVLAASGASALATRLRESTRSHRIDMFHCCACEAGGNSTAEIVGEPAHPYFMIQVVGVQHIRDSDWLPSKENEKWYVEVECAGNVIGKTTDDVVFNPLRPRWENEEIPVTEASVGDIEFKVYVAEYNEGEEINFQCLAQAVISLPQFASDGFNGEVPLVGKFQETASLSLKIKRSGQPYPPSQNTFTVEVEKGDKAGYGLAIDCSDGKSLVVQGIEDGAFLDYNTNAEASERIMPSDFVLSVNGESKLTDCIKQFQQSKVTCVIARGTGFSCILKREDIDKPLGLVFPEQLKTKSVGVRIKSICHFDSVVKEYNDRNYDKIQPYDRIVSVKGETGTPDEIKYWMETTTGQFQVQILRCMEEESSGYRL